MSELPIVITTSGLVPLAPATARANIIAAVAAESPDYTANLPAIMIGDMVGTETASVLQCDSALVELINSLTPFGCNAFILAQQGAMLGVPIGLSTNTSVYVVFQSSQVGFFLAAGWVVSDGTYTYITQDGVTIASGGYSPAVLAIATVAGSWAVPTGTVINTVTQPPSSAITVSVNNPSTGFPGTAAQTETSYRTDVLVANRAASQGMNTYLKTLMRNVPGVQSRLVSTRQVNGLWEIIVGGGDQYAIAQAIYDSLFQINNLTGSVIGITAVTNADPGQITTNINHGYATGQVVTPEQVGGMTELNGTAYTITVVSETVFTIGVDTTSYSSYTSGGYCTPNFRNTVVSFYDYPDTYSIPFVVPPQQSVAIGLTWNTDSANTISPTSFQQLSIPAIVAYINSITVGQPINQFELNAVVQAAVLPILPTNLLSRMVWTVSINNVSVTPTSGTGLYNGDPESYLYIDSSTVTVTQG